MVITMYMKNDKPAVRSRSKYALPTKKMTTSKQFELLRAFAIASTRDRKPVSIQDVANVQHIHSGSVSMCNAFYVESGLITKMGNKFVPSSDVFAYEQSADWKNENAGHKLAPAIKETWFAKAILPRLQLNSMQENRVIQALSEASHAPPSEQRSLRMLVDYLEFCGLVEHDNGTIKLVKNNGDTFAPQEEASAPIKDDSQNRKEKTIDDQMGGADYDTFSIPIPGHHPANFQIPKNMEPEDWEVLTGMLQMYLDRLKKKTKVN